MDIKESNKIIADFMGAKQCPCGEVNCQRKSFDGSTLSYEPNDLRYHTSWDWLMPVVEKIEGLGFDFHIIQNDTFVFHDDINGPIGGVAQPSGTKIQSTYKTAVVFIQWYNSQNLNNGKE